MSKSKAGEFFYDSAGNLCTFRANGTLRVTTINDEPSKTIQSEKDSCDINLIVAKFNSTGVMTNIAKGSPLSGDFSEPMDYQTALNRVLAADEAFMALPAQLRKKFDNDPGKLISFLDDPENRSEGIALGLLNPVSQDSQIPLDSEASKPGASSPDDV